VYRAGVEIEGLQQTFGRHPGIGVVEPRLDDVPLLGPKHEGRAPDGLLDPPRVQLVDGELVLHLGIFCGEPFILEA